MKFGKFNGIPERDETTGFEWGTIKVDNNGFIDTAGEGDVKISGHPVSWWQKNYSLPLHIIFAPIMAENIRNYKKVFEEHYPNGHIRVAGKVNAHPSVFKYISQEGVGCDVASLNEMKAALQGGIDPEDLDVNGNAKSDRLISEGVKRNMFFIADSLAEMKTIHNIAQMKKTKARVALRVAGFDMANVTDANIFTAGIWSKFGENLENIPEIIQNLDRFPYLDFQGFHSHVGSQITESSAYQTVIGKLIELSHLLQKQDRDVKILNIGGGFPAEYVKKSEWQYLVNRVRAGYIAAKKGEQDKTFVWNNEPSGLAIGKDGKIDHNVWSGEEMYSEFPREKMLEKILTETVPVFGKEISLKQALKELGSPRIVIEPGRSIAEDSGITLVKVSHVRKVAGNHFLTTLEANVTNFATAMLLPPVNSWTIMNDTRSSDKMAFETFLAGNLCYSGDIISKYKVFLQREPKRGDILGCYHTGAYDPNFFAANTNSFPRPARILTDENGVIDIIKKRDTFEDIFSTPEKELPDA